MVDSDQLAVRPNYSEYLKQSLALSPGVGMLSNKPRRLTLSDNEDIEVWPAMQGLKEFYLWKPLLQKFTNGEDKFVHWTFWPSSVFTADASRDLVKLFKESRLLNEIMNQTNIWATEEVILPTLTALLGYEIGNNPCSYEYVKYQKYFSTTDADYALNKPTTFWMHPVYREHDDALRKKIRGHFNNYTTEAEGGQPVTRELLPVLPLINKIRKIEGWLTDEEADLVIATVINACMQCKQPMIITEVGSFHGKSTVLFGSVLQQYSPASKIFSIDPHDGRQGAEDHSIFVYPPSYNSFKKNIEEAGISHLVECLQDDCCNIEWDQPVSILFIDGLHDYKNVSKDFNRFEQWLVEDAYIIFHDYADYFPGVKTFVNALLESNKYHKVDCVNSLIVLKRLMFKV